MKPGIYVISADYELTDSCPARLVALQKAGLKPYMPAGTKIKARPSFTRERWGKCSLYGTGGLGLWPEHWPWLTYLLEKSDESLRG